MEGVLICKWHKEEYFQISQIAGGDIWDMFSVFTFLRAEDRFSVFDTSLKNLMSGESISSGLYAFLNRIYSYMVSVCGIGFTWEAVGARGENIGKSFGFYGKNARAIYVMH